MTENYFSLHRAVQAAQKTNEHFDESDPRSVTSANAMYIISNVMLQEAAALKNDLLVEKPRKKSNIISPKFK